MAEKRMEAYDDAYEYAYDYAHSHTLTEPHAEPSGAHRPAGRQEPRPIPRRRVVSRGVHIPVWVVWVVVGSAMFIFCFTLVHMRSVISGAQKQVSSLSQQLSHAEEVESSLQIKIAAASDPERIHAVATNWLNMRIPRADEIRSLPNPSSLQTPEPMAKPNDGGGLFRQLLNFVGF